MVKDEKLEWRDRSLYISLFADDAKILRRIKKKTHKDCLELHNDINMIYE